MQYQDMVIEVSEPGLDRLPDKRRLGRFKVRVLDSPAGAMKPEEAVPIQYDDKELQAALQKLEKRELDKAGLIGLGRTLAMLLLPPDKHGGASMRDLLASSLREAGSDGGLRLRLRLPLQLAVLPWEFIYVDRTGGGDGMDGFLALDPRVAIVRHEVMTMPADLPKVSGDIKVVAALASAGGPQLDLAKERDILNQALGSKGGITPVFLEDATLDEVQSAIPGAGVFYFAGHGVFMQDMASVPGAYSGTGKLALDDQLVDAEQLGINLRGNGVRLAVLGGCETGRRDGINVWSGIAPALVKAEVPAVVANQYTILDKCAIAFSEQFYRALVGGLSIERAVTAGRIAAYNADQEGRDWGVAVLYLRGANGEFFEGAASKLVREQARSGAEVNVNIRAKEVAAGGEISGGEIGTMLSGKLAVQIDVSGTVYGKVAGPHFKQIGGGSVQVTEDIGTVGTGGVVTGPVIDNLG